MATTRKPAPGRKASAEQSATESASVIAKRATPKSGAAAKSPRAAAPARPAATRTPNAASAASTAQPATADSTTAAATRAAKGARRPSGHAHPPRVSYDHAAIERKWSERWLESGINQVDLAHAPRPYYNLMMFPYPSAEGLHVGNMYAFTGADIHGRYMAARGYDVFEPMGFDAFGIHSENYAIKVGKHPRLMTERNVANFRTQLKRIGNRFDWTHEVDSTDPAYYRWTQWIFVKLFEAGLAERKRATVNWCPKDKTVLADEQVIAGRCERCDTLVEQRSLESWFFKITSYADRLLRNLDWIDWSEKIKVAQRNWIGRSEGAEIRFTAELDGERIEVPVFTTRPDTIYGVTFFVLAPEHPLVDRLTTPEQQAAVRAYVAGVNHELPRDRAEQDRPKTGVPLGSYVTNPVSGARVPVWVADYVLLGYGTGAIMGVPAHDQRDFAFARAFDLPIVPVIWPADEQPTDPATWTAAQSHAGVMVNSAEFDGTPPEDAIRRVTAWCEQHGVGRAEQRYRLRDWLISRQRYWGPPIPIIYCPDHGAVAVPERDLPVLLPEVEDYLPTGTGDSPLSKVPSFVNTTCPTCGKPARRETDVSDNFLDSAWYYLRYPSVGDDTQPWDPELTRKWLPVDSYIGGAEHAVLHLLYTRFVCMALHDLGYLDFEEPFKRFHAHGILRKNGVKISKSKGNVVNPDEYITAYGADVFRLDLLFMGPYDQGIDFHDRGLGGVTRFLDRTWQLVTRHASDLRASPPRDEARRALHHAIKRVTEETEALKYNTGIAALMEYLNTLEARPELHREEVETYLRLLAPYAPFITEELWERIGNGYSIHQRPWPEYDSAALRTATVTIVVQVDGRMRDRIQAPADASAGEVERLAREAPNAARAIGQRTVRQVIQVPGRLVNIVTG
jgi:leucyl-tRNA synthetase